MFCEGEEKLRRKEGKYLGKENILCEEKKIFGEGKYFFCEGEEEQRRKTRKIFFLSRRRKRRTIWRGKIYFFCIRE